MAEALARGEAIRDRWLAGREDRLNRAIADVASQATADETARIARFCLNVLRKTRPYHSEATHFAFPGLVEREFHPRGEHHWLSELESATEIITAELETAMSAERAELVPYIQYERA